MITPRLKPHIYRSPNNYWIAHFMNEQGYGPTPKLAYDYLIQSLIAKAQYTKVRTHFQRGLMDAYYENHP